MPATMRKAVMRKSVMRKSVMRKAGQRAERQSGSRGNRRHDGPPRRPFVRRSRAAPALLALALLALAAAGAGAQNLKFGSLAPQDTVWDTAMRRIGVEWNRISGGAIDITVFPGGVAGDEVDMVRKMRTGQLDGAAVSAVGLATVYPGVLALGMPFMFENQEELTHVTERLQPVIEEEFARRGFKVLSWTAAGWVYFFSREPGPTPADLQRQKLNVPEASPQVVDAWKETGFRIAEHQVTELMLGLQTGAVDAVLNSPLIVAPFQWFGIARHMNALEIAPFYGAMVMSVRSWRRLPRDIQSELLASAQEIGRETAAEVLAAERAAVEIMRRFGLIIHEPTPEQAAAWRVLQHGFEPLVGPVVEERVFRMVTDALAEYRAGRAAASP